MTGRFLAALAALALALTAGSGAVQAQTYGPKGPPPGCPVEDPPPDDPPPCPPRGDATVSDSTVAPGQATTITVPAGSFDPGSAVTFRLVRIRPGSAPETLATGTAAGDGAVTRTVTVPAGTAGGVYLLYVEGIRNGRPFVSLVPLVVTAPASAASTPNGGGASSASSTSTVPPAVTVVQQGASVASEASLLEAADDGARVTLHGNRLVALGPAETAAPSAKWGAADADESGRVGMVLLITAAGLVAVRLGRRRGATR